MKCTKDFTPVVLALQQSRTAILKYLLDNGADVNATLEDGVTMLLRAGMTDKLDAVKILVEKGADVNVPGPSDLTPFLMFIQRGRLDMLEYLLENGADMNAVMNARAMGLTALHFAVSMGNMEIVKWLLKKDANINAQTLEGDSPLMVAIYRRLDDIAEYLIKNDADLSVARNDGLCALGAALRTSEDRVIAMLTDRKAPITSTSPKYY